MPQKGQCEMDSINSCPAWQPLCAETWHGQEVPILPMTFLPSSAPSQATTSPMKTTTVANSTKHSATTSPAESTTLASSTKPSEPSSSQSPKKGNVTVQASGRHAGVGDAPPFCFTLCQKTDVRSVNSSCAALTPASCESAQFFETDGDGKRRLCRLHLGHCRVDRSAVCDEWWPLCEISHHDAGVKPHYDDPRPSHQAGVSGCFLYCDKINTRTWGVAWGCLSHSFLGPCPP